MQYIGGKYRIATEIAKIINSIKASKVYIEPFCGACWVTQYVDKRIIYAYDSNESLINLWIALQNGWIPPESISEDEYNQLKNAIDSPLRTFAGLGCSFSGKWFGGYARETKSDRNYCLNTRNSLLKKIQRLRNVNFKCVNFFDIEVENTIMYLDPPYEGTTQNGYIQESFDSDLFWKHADSLSKSNVVLVSEYKAPKGFICFKEFKTKTDMRDSENQPIQRIERLFTTANNFQYVKEVSLFD